MEKPKKSPRRKWPRVQQSTALLIQKKKLKKREKAYDFVKNFKSSEVASAS